MAKVADNALLTFSEWKIRDIGSFLIFKLKNGKIEVDRIGEKNATWEEFTSSLKDDEPCWVWIFSYFFLINFYFFRQLIISLTRIMKMLLETKQYFYSGFQAEHQLKIKCSMLFGQM
jgi:hypothetical protein